ncbi:hypothetical protein RhiirB3_468594 [Rhizophagus irregularis]|nr:hypothetical protein RhiirB3_468594 [Rhizophagus irregularis]
MKLKSRVFGVQRGLLFGVFAVKGDGKIKLKRHLNVNSYWGCYIRMCRCGHIRRNVECWENQMELICTELVTVMNDIVPKASAKCKKNGPPNSFSSHTHDQHNSGQIDIPCVSWEKG